MKRFTALGLVMVGATLVTGCQETAGSGKEEAVYELVNGGFETGDLTGWTVLEGDAFSEDVIATKTTFWEDNIPYGKTGNWHLVGTGFDDAVSENEIGKLKSSTFTLGGDGIISFKLGAGRDVEKCYLAIYLTEGDKLIAKQGNEDFSDPGIANITQYEAGLAATNNYNDYSLDLSDYLGQEMYIVLVDEDNDGDFGFLNVDDIRTYYVDGEAAAQEDGAVVEKVRTYDEVLPENEYVIANPGFESGNLSGWTFDGGAFDHKAVTADSTWWAEAIPYNRDGEYHFGIFNEGETGTLRSTEFELAGSGVITFKLGGGKSCADTYMSVVNAEDGTEVARYCNTEFADVNFPNVDQGLRLANLELYKADLSEHLGKKLYIEFVDHATTDWGLLTIDSVETYHELAPTDGIEAVNQIK